MDSIDKKVIMYNGIQDMSVLERDDMVVYTSIKTLSSGLMEQSEFKQYLDTGYKFKNKTVYIHKDYKVMNDVRKNI